MTLETIHVVAGIIVKDDRFFVAKRNPGGPAGGKWEFPGGKVEIGEDPRHALVRELREELDIHVTVGEQLGIFETQVGTRLIALDCYWVQEFSGDIKLSSHTNCSWVTKAELVCIDLAEPDLPATRKILNSQI